MTVVARIGVFARAVVAVTVAGALAAAAFLLACTVAEHFGVTSLRVGDALRTLAGDAAAPPDPDSQVVRTVGPSGIYASLAAATALMGINAVVNELSGRRWPWRARAAGLAVMTFLVAGVAFGPLAASLASPGAEVPGLFGIDAGPWTPVSLALASLVFGIVGARVYGLMRSPEWWRTEADIPAERVPDEASPPS